MADVTFTPIAGRYIPPGKGIDLEQALNYVQMDGLDVRWFYTSFTYPRTFYQKGSRPFLQEVVAQATVLDAPQMSKLEACLQVVLKRVPHANFLSFRVPPDRAMTEEELIRSGAGWCNEQARVLLALTQVAGLPSRLVFAQMPNGKGHVLSEAYVDGKWVLVDQTDGFIFRLTNGTPLNVQDLKTDAAVWAEVDALYKAKLMSNRAWAKDLAFWEKQVKNGYARVEHPLDLFYKVGYCNYFIH